MQDNRFYGLYCHPGLEQQDQMIINDIFIGDAYRTGLIGKVRDNEVVVDVGAHIGSFTHLWWSRNRTARLFSIEACYDNIEYLKANVSAYSTVIHAACTYESGLVGMLNAVLPGSCTGGGIVAPMETVVSNRNTTYSNDVRQLDKVSIHDLFDRYGLDRIDFLKLDCEGSEFSILEYAPLDRIGFIFAESHGADRWNDLLARKFVGWDKGHMAQHGDFGIWHLGNPDRNKW